MLRLDITNQRFGRLTALNFAYTKNKRSYWNCVCDCGKNKNGLSGVVYKGGKKYPFASCIRVNKKTIHLGSFKTAQEAHQKWLDFKTKLKQD